MKHGTRQGLGLDYLKPVVLFYTVVLLGLGGIAWIIGIESPPTSSYDLRSSNPISILTAPFANNWSDFAGSAPHIAFYVVIFWFLLFLDSNLKYRPRLRLFFCAAPILGGIIGSFVYFVRIALTSIPSAGAGSSIIAASMTGVTLALSLVAAANLWDQNSTAAALFCMILVGGLVWVFIGDFLFQGNLPAHLYGFTSGMLLTAGYLVRSKREKEGSQG